MTFFKLIKINVKETWKGISKLIKVSKKATTNIDKIVENGKETTNPIEIADALNTFYVFHLWKVCRTKNPETKNTIFSLFS